MNAEEATMSEFLTENARRASEQDALLMAENDAEPVHPTQEQRHLWANARMAHALLSGAPYTYLWDPSAQHDDDVWGDLILVNWKGQEIVCPVPVVIDMLHPDSYTWYGSSQTVAELIGYAPVEYRERE